MSVTEGWMPRTLRETADREPFDFYERMRTAGPVVWDDSMGSWLVTSRSACKEVQRSEEQAYRHAYLDMGSDVFVEVEGGPRNLLFLPGADHQRVHRLLLRLLNPNAVEVHRETLVRPLVRSLMDAFAPTGSAELAHEFAELLPVRVIAALMDLPYRDEEWIRTCKHCMDEIAIFLEAFSVDDDEVVQRAIAASNRMNDLLMPYILQRRDGDGEDLISRLWRGGAEALDGWDEIDMRANVRIIFFGGSDTTTHVLANAFYVLMTDPELANAVRAGGTETIGRFVEEALRLYGAIHFRPRVANRDVELAGCPIGANQHLLTVNMAANRDPEHYPSPDDVRLDRPAPRDHLAFHSGPRTCIGAALARVELQESIAAFLQRFPDARLDPDAEPPRFEGFLMRSYRPLHARFAPAPMS
ncbi:MAG TPA: cytochrome P450 [Solirubrobacteraceae bacterium]|nr:cytochrome P450 [Solirubrobacteraceae bacterium]